MNFNNIYTHGIVRVAAATFEVTLGDPRANARRVVELAHAAAESQVAVLAFPRDCLAGATVGDWGDNASVTARVHEALAAIATQTADLPLLLVVGARLRGVSRAVFITGGTVSDFAEYPGGVTTVNLPDLRVLPLVGEDLLGAYAATAVGVTAGEFGSILPRGLASSGANGTSGAAWAAGVPLEARPQPPTVLVQLAAPAHTVGVRRRLHRAARELSRSAGAAVVLAAGSRGESSTDAAYLAEGFIAANGQVLASEEHLGAAGLTIADVILPELPAARDSTNWKYSGCVEGIYGDPDNLAEAGNTGLYTRLIDDTDPAPNGTSAGDADDPNQGDPAKHAVAGAVYPGSNAGDTAFADPDDPGSNAGDAAFADPDDPAAPADPGAYPGSNAGDAAFADADDSAAPAAPGVYSGSNAGDTAFADAGDSAAPAAPGVYPGWVGSGDFWLDVDFAAEIPLLEPPAQRPLVPGSARRYRADLAEAFEVQVAGLMRRLSALRDSNIVLGLSGGLDSTLALLVAVAEKGGRGETGHGGVSGESDDSQMAPHEHATKPTGKLATNGKGAGGAGGNQAGTAAWREGILAFTMPGFATGAASLGLATDLAAALDVDCEEIDIRATATEMLRTIGHPAGAGEAVYDVTFENVQAGLRADYLFRLANQRGGFVLGTGDLSEAALGWCTYGVGDHMSHYAVNAGVPKSLMPDLIRVAARVLSERGLVADSAALHEVISGIISADITPELIPDYADAATGEARHQTTEGTIGPYILHDFFLYHTLRGASPRLVAFLALAAFSRPDTAASRGASLDPPCEGNTEPTPHESEINNPAAAEDVLNPQARRYFSRAEILKWLRVFYRRFLTQQFKRTAMPSAPVIWEGMSLSPRAGFHFPADLSPEAALAELADL